MYKITCPKCNSENFNSFDINCYPEEGIVWDECCCDDCGSHFYVKYTVADIVLEDFDED